MTIFYTNAPKDYDYGCTDELDPDVGRLTSGMDQDKPVRKIDIRGDGWHAETQIMRNSSGLYPTLTEEQFEEWVEAEFLILNPGGDENSDEAPAESTPSPGFDATCPQCGVSAHINAIGTTCRLCGSGVIIMSTTNVSEPEEDDDCPKCHGLGTVPNTNDASLNVRMPCPDCGRKTFNKSEAQRTAEEIEFGDKDQWGDEQEEKGE
jgi:hypothetical protein